MTKPTEGTKDLTPPDLTRCMASSHSELMPDKPHASISFSDDPVAKSIHLGRWAALGMAVAYATNPLTGTHGITGQVHEPMVGDGPGTIYSYTDASGDTMVDATKSGAPYGHLTFTSDHVVGVQTGPVQTNHTIPVDQVRLSRMVDLKLRCSSGIQRTRITASTTGGTTPPVTLLVDGKEVARLDSSQAHSDQGTKTSMDAVLTLPSQVGATRTITLEIDEGSASFVVVRSKDGYDLTPMQPTNDKSLRSGPTLTNDCTHSI